MRPSRRCGVTRESFGLEAGSAFDDDEAFDPRAFDARRELTRRGLVPLALLARGEWRPDEEAWGAEGEPLPTWARAIIEQGPRPAFEMEQVVPGQQLSRPFLYELLEADVRCLDAHAYLGNAAFEHYPAEALRHFRTTGPGCAA